MIEYCNQSKTFYLESKDVTYAFRVDEYGHLQHIYYGKRIAREDLTFGIFSFDRGHAANPPYTPRGKSLTTLQNECPTYGRSDQRESMLAFDFDGVRVGDLLYTNHVILEDKPALCNMPSVKGKQTLIVHMQDELHGVKASLFYTVFEDLPVILRHVELTNESAKTFVIDRAYSFCVDMPDKNWETIVLPGGHMKERFMDRRKLSYGVFSVDSKCGVSSGQMNPFMALVRKNTDENQGETYGYNLVYSGDFVFKAQVEQNGEVRVLGGVNDYDFSWELQPSATFVTPEVVMVYSQDGLGGMSRAFHDLYRQYLINPRYVNEVRPIVINNWEATYFRFDTQKLCAIIDSIAGTGIDTFVLDDGWFGARNHDRAGLGDWVVNTEKLPGGLKTIIDHAHKKGIKFGLWFEPEMVNPDSDLYRAHPDWAIHVDGLAPCLGRDQLVLDLTRDDVCEYIIQAVSDILRENEIDYVKWDMNRVLTDNYSATLGKRGKEMHHRYVLGLYKICEGIVNAFPNVIFEGCASGGCRFDPAMLYYFPQIWTSDNSDAYLRTIIQYGTSLCYPLSTMSCHVSVCPNHQCGRVTPFAARADIAHLGATGYELDTTKLTTEDITAIKAQVEEYKKIQDLVLFGDLYRLNNPLEENLFAEQMVSKDKTKAYIVAMRPLSAPNYEAFRIYPKGLDENADYFVQELGITKKGCTWMGLGIVAKFAAADFTTNRYTFIKV